MKSEQKSCIIIHLYTSNIRSTLKSHGSPPLPDGSTWHYFSHPLEKKLKLSLNIIKARYL